MIKRHHTKVIKLGNLKIGGKNPVAIQSMTNTDTKNVVATVKQILALEKTGVDIVRVAVPDREAAQALAKIKRKICVPLVADIHFDYRLAVLAIENGADKIRINPGNIASEKHLLAIIDAAKKYNVPLRIGINAGSLEKAILKKYQKPCAAAMVESALKYIEFFERNNFYKLIISLKSSNVPDTIEANRSISKQCNYPLHLGVTESGTLEKGGIRSSVALGTLLAEGIGDTIRVSLSADPVSEVKVAQEILRSLHLRNDAPRIICCPTCARTKIDVIYLANKLEKALENSPKKITIAVMGCEVNGPGEAKLADLGVVGGIEFGTIYKNGKIIQQVKKNKIYKFLEAEIKHF